MAGVVRNRGSSRAGGGGVRGGLRRVQRHRARGRGGSGTASIHLGLAALGVGPGDEVVTRAHLHRHRRAGAVAGARPRFVDVDEDRVHGPQGPAGDVDGAAAVVPVHLYGRPADMPAIGRRRRAGAGDEDAAQAHGAIITPAGGEVRRAGSVGRLAAFSFYPGKNLGAFGDAGAVTTDDDEMADRVAGCVTTAGPPSTSMTRSASPGGSTPSRPPSSG